MNEKKWNVSTDPHVRLCRADGQDYGTGYCLPCSRLRFSECVDFGRNALLLIYRQCGHMCADRVCI